MNSNPVTWIKRTNGEVGTPTVGDYVEVWRGATNVPVPSANSAGLTVSQAEFLACGHYEGAIQRLPYFDNGVNEGRVFFLVKGEEIPATEDNDIALPLVIHPDTGGLVGSEPRCPDCGQDVLWAEAGRVPGARRCAGESEESCGSVFVDTRYGVGLTYEDDL